ncbi:hypothetical protein [Gordonia sp. NPDC003376]
MDKPDIHPSITIPDVVRRPDVLAEEALTAEQFAADFQRLRGRGHIERSTLMSATERIIAVVGQAGDLEPSEIVAIDGILVTSSLRTAFDLGRQPSRRRALGRLDALAAAAAVDLDELAAFARKQKHTRNVRQIRELIPHIDPRAESPGESWLRLFFSDAGMPKPESQVEVFDEYARLIARFDLAYRGPRVAVEYDGEEFHSSPEQKRHDVVRDDEVGVLGWVVVRANKQRMVAPPEAWCLLRVGHGECGAGVRSANGAPTSWTPRLSCRDLSSAQHTSPSGTPRFPRNRPHGRYPTA